MCSTPNWPRTTRRPVNWASDWPSTRWCRAGWDLIKSHDRLAFVWPALSRTRLLLQIHDELVIEAPEAESAAAEAILIETMETAMELEVPPWSMPRPGSCSKPK